MRQQSLTERLLVTLVDVRKAQNVLRVRRRKLQEGFVACNKVLLLACDQQHAVPARQPQNHLPHKSKRNASVSSA